MNSSYESPFVGLDDEHYEQDVFSSEDEQNPDELEDELAFLNTETVDDFAEPTGELDDAFEGAIDEQEVLGDEPFAFEEEGLGHADESLADFEPESTAYEDPGTSESEAFHETQFVPTSDFEAIEDPAAYVEEEVFIGKRLKSIRALAAPPPCHPDSPAPTRAPGGRPRDGTGWRPRRRRRPSRVPDYRPGAGRVRRRASSEYVRWVQRSLNQILGTALAVDGIWGWRTSRALREFQRRAEITVDGRIGPQSEAALRRWTRSDPPSREVPFEGVAPAAAAAAAAGGASALGIANFVLNFVKFGFDIVRRATAGGIQLIAPQGAVGIKVTNRPPEFRLEPRQKTLLIFNYTSTIGGAEAVRVKLRAKVQYDGLNLQVRFGFDPGGDRSRLGADTVIKIDKPFDLENEKAPVEWQRCGVPDYRVLRIPISIRIDRPWPLSNYNENFELVLSTMYGFGASGRTGRAHIQNPVVKSN